jgi:DNA-binding NarL/FixJ family response regulator
MNCWLPCEKFCQVENTSSESVAEKLAESVGENDERPAYQLLSDRELQVLQYIASGKTVSEIGDELSLSVQHH